VDRRGAGKLLTTKAGHFYGFRIAADNRTVASARVPPSERRAELSLAAGAVGACGGDRELPKPKFRAAVTSSRISRPAFDRREPSQSCQIWCANRESRPTERPPRRTVADRPTAPWGPKPSSTGTELLARHQVSEAPDP
jgi:hypothetical protein